MLRSEWAAHIYDAKSVIQRCKSKRRREERTGEDRLEREEGSVTHAFEERTERDCQYLNDISRSSRIAALTFDTT